jgi:steroid 5-alpha reductase family enzyme
MNTKRTQLALFLIIVPIVIVAVAGPEQWSVNWPTMFGIALLLVALGREPLSNILW